MTDAEILDVIREVARTQLDHRGPLDPDADLGEALQLDSLRAVSLLVGLEMRFRIAFDPDDEAGLVRVGDLVPVIRRRLARG